MCWSGQLDLWRAQLFVLAAKVMFGSRTLTPELLRFDIKGVNSHLNHPVILAQLSEKEHHLCSASKQHVANRGQLTALLHLPILQGQ